MTLRKFFEQALREYEKKLNLPPGWWGSWRDVHGPRDVRVRFCSRDRWSVSQKGKRVSMHDSRASAIRKAKKLVKGVA